MMLSFSNVLTGKGNTYTKMKRSWGWVKHICINKLIIIGSDNGLSPGRRQAIIWTNAGILLIGTLGTNFSEILSEIHIFSFMKMHFKVLSAKWLAFCLGLNVLILILPRQFHWDMTVAIDQGVCWCLEVCVHHSWGPFYSHGLTLIPAWISNHNHHNVWYQITYPFPNFNGATVGSLGFDK